MTITLYNFVSEMKQTFKKYFLLLCIILLGGYTHVSSHTTVKEMSNTTQEAIAQSLGLTVKFDFQTDDNSANKHSLTAREKGREKIEITESEIEEEEILHVKKYLDYSDYFGLFCIKISDPHSYLLGKTLPFGKAHLFYSSLESLYIVFRVFRL